MNGDMHKEVNVATANELSLEIADLVMRVAGGHGMNDPDLNVLISTALLMAVHRLDVKIPKLSLLMVIGLMEDWPDTLGDPRQMYRKFK